MKGILVVIAFMYYLQIKLCTGKTTARNGYCISNYTEQVTTRESYMHEYTIPELQLCNHGFRYYNCWRDVKKTEIRTKTVPKSVTRTKIECCAGYKNTTVHENIYNCEPICDPPCIKGHCTMPGNCTCFQGYQHEESNKCIPKCKPDCINGICTLPDHCECKKGYDKVNSSYCEPHCSHNCKNGVCHKPDECLCNTGYTKSSNDPFDCEPICDIACINATCTAYNECTCLSGYGKISNQSNACKPICGLECLNGDCTAPNTCTCHEGYSKKDSPNICVADCANCDNGFCTKPNVCECYQNFTYTDQGNCEPICNNCSNGVCIAPYQCECNDFYQQDDDGKCIPICDNCGSGKCIEPNVCSCLEGFENNVGSCIPVCKYGCFAGECIAPNNCSCQEYDKVEENICFPLQKDETNSTGNITPKRFIVDILKIPNNTDTYNLDLSTVYIKTNCSDKAIYNTSSGNEMNSSYSIECSNIKHPLGLYVLCIWNGFSLDIQYLYTENLQSINHELNETETEEHHTKLGMTVLFPTNTVEDEGCYLCPSPKLLRATMPDNFRIPLIPCQVNSHQNEATSFGWEGMGMIGLAVLVSLLLIMAGLMIFFRKQLRRNYYVHSSGQIDQIALSLNQED